MSGVGFENIPGSGLVAPLLTFELTSGGTFESPARELIVGHKNTGASIPLNTPTPVSSHSEVRQIAGVGSMALGGRHSQLVVFGGENPEKRPDLQPGNAALYDHNGHIVRVIDEGLKIDVKDQAVEIRQGSMDQVRRYTHDYLVYLRAKIGEHLENDGTLADAYYVDQSPYEHLDTFKELATRNAGRVFEHMEFE